MADFKLLKENKRFNKGGSVDISPDGLLFVIGAGSNKTALVYNAENGKIVHKLTIDDEY